jgi:co-chaperonin GroES (HSP10)
MLKAQGSWVVVQPVKDSQETDSKIIVPDAAKERMEAEKDSGLVEVISVGSEVEGIEAGNICMLLMGSCFQMPPVDGKSYLATRADRVICRVADNG